MQSCAQAVGYISRFYSTYYQVPLSDADKKQQEEDIKEELIGSLHGMIDPDKQMIDQQYEPLFENLFDLSDEDVDTLFTHIRGAEQYRLFLRMVVGEIIMQTLDLENALPVSEKNV